MRVAEREGEEEKLRQRGGDETVGFVRNEVSGVRIAGVSSRRSMETVIVEVWWCRWGCVKMFRLQDLLVAPIT